MCHFDYEFSCFMLNNICFLYISRHKQGKMWQYEAPSFSNLLNIYALFNIESLKKHPL